MSQLSKRTIVECALTLTQEEGARALTIRRIGKRLGVDPTALYRHFPKKDDLVLACMDEVLGRALSAFENDSTFSGAQDDWRSIIRGATSSFFHVGQEYPGIVSSCFFRVTGGRHERRWVELFMETLSSAGLSPEETALHYRAIVDAMLSLTGLRCSVICMTPELILRDRLAWSQIYAHLPTKQFPATRAHSAELAAVTPEEVFEEIMDTVINAVELAVARAHARERRGVEGRLVSPGL